MKNTQTMSDRITELQLAQLKSRQITTTQLAEELGVSLTHLSRTLSKAGFEKDPSTIVEYRKTASENFNKRANDRINLAKQVLQNKIPIEVACCEGRCSERTMYRYISKLKGTL